MAMSSRSRGVCIPAFPQVRAGRARWGSSEALHARGLTKRGRHPTAYTPSSSITPKGLKGTVACNNAPHPTHWEFTGGRGDAPPFYALLTIGPHPNSRRLQNRAKIECLPRQPHVIRHILGHPEGQDWALKWPQSRRLKLNAEFGTISPPEHTATPDALEHPMIAKLLAESSHEFARSLSLV